MIIGLGIDYVTWASVVKPSKNFFFLKKFFFLLGNSLLGNTFFY